MVSQIEEFYQRHAADAPTLGTIFPLCLISASEFPIPNEPFCDDAKNLDSKDALINMA